MSRLVWDVAVAGGGPAGATAAALLAQQGYRVVLVDRARFPRRKTCAEYLSPGTEDLLVRLGLGDVFARERPHRFAGMEIVSPRGARYRVQYAQNGRSRQACSLQRERLDAAIVGFAAAQGVEVREGVIARGALLDGQTVVGLRSSCAGRDEPIRARLTIVADGARSATARSLGLSTSPRWPVRLGLVAHFDGTVLPTVCGQMHVYPDGYCGVAPLPDGRMNVAIVTRADALARATRQPVAFFDRWLATHDAVGTLLADAARVSPVSGLVPIGARVRRVWAPGALLVGDAAGFFDPFTGEGIFRALRGAEVAAEVAGRALQMDDLSGAALAKYAALRTYAFRRKAAVTALVQLFVQFPALMEYALPRLNGRAGPSESLGAVLGDIREAGDFLRPSMLWAALRP